MPNRRFASRCERAADRWRHLHGLAGEPPLKFKDVCPLVPDWACQEIETLRLEVAEQARKTKVLLAFVEFDDMRIAVPDKYVAILRRMNQEQQAVPLDKRALWRQWDSAIEEYRGFVGKLVTLMSI